MSWFVTLDPMNDLTFPPKLKPKNPATPCRASDHLNWNIQYQLLLLINIITTYILYIKCYIKLKPKSVPQIGSNRYVIWHNRRSRNPQLTNLLGNGHSTSYIYETLCSHEHHTIILTKPTLCSITICQIMVAKNSKDHLKINLKKSILTFSNQ
jgi:hypothetical protein